MHPVLRKIERHLKSTGGYASRFGREAINDPRLVADLRKGREPGATTVARIEALIRVSGSGEMTGTDAIAAVLIEKAGGGVCESASSVDWCSGAFVGRQHAITLAFDDRRTCERLTAGLDDYDFGLAHDFVADIQADRPTIDGTRIRVALRALTISAE